jgi:hypothetical protein
MDLACGRSATCVVPIVAGRRSYRNDDAFIQATSDFVLVSNHSVLPGCFHEMKQFWRRPLQRPLQQPTGTLFEFLYGERPRLGHELLPVRERDVQRRGAEVIDGVGSSIALCKDIEKRMVGKHA